jgi:putative Mg2+ transporter-C (MgtC) family protein
MNEALTLSVSTVALRLLLAFVLGGIIGLERERRDRPAGLRTHILVTVAAALLMMLSRLVAGESADPGRIAAGVVTGIGFLGAGTIIRSGADVHGLTTAATLWAASAVGLTVGIGSYSAAIVATAIIFITLTALRRLERYIGGVSAEQRIAVQLTSGASFPTQMLAELRDAGVYVESIDFAGEGGEQVVMYYQNAEGVSRERLMEIASRQDNIASVKITP